MTDSAEDPKPPRRKKWGIACISGFTETDRERTGMDDLQRIVQEHFEEWRNVEVYDLRPWKHDAKGLASLMERDSITDAIVIGYSWGGGYGAPRLCRELLALDIQVPIVLLCDPVFRPQWLPAVGPANVLAFRALIPGQPVIKFPAGVQRIEGYRQENNTPRGHRVQIGKDAPITLPRINRASICHSNIDSSYEFRELVVDEVAAHVGASLSL